MSSIWRLLFGLILWLVVLMQVSFCQDDLELDYSNEYDDVRPHLIYPDEPRLDKRLTEAAKEFGDNIRNTWQSMVDSFRSYFEELRNVFAEGVESNVETFPVAN
ncbi:uncharacterized protein LOC6565440 [Drosophila grimshawi]|uniref:GH12428 n=1 Tax=Drosophila grimshawi TaxID=7222 RepID=B4JJ32_DROGR|nr:uncharacterized protein LOC6565440 [Drosophila grimshawi]EDV99584.1 GH12428 [Drosophila grimshawi]